MLNVDDRVVHLGLRMLYEPDRYGKVIEVYKGSVDCKGVPLEFVEIEWEDTKLREKGYLRSGGMLQVVTTL